jgi:hypothetical protein
MRREYSAARRAASEGIVAPSGVDGDGGTASATGGIGERVSGTKRSPIHRASNAATVRCRDGEPPPTASGE